MRSPPFTITVDTKLSFQTRGGNGPNSNPMRESVVGEPAVAEGLCNSRGFMGIALQDVSTGTWVASKHKLGDSEDGDETIVFSQSALYELVGKTVTVDLVD